MPTYHLSLIIFLPCCAFLLQGCTQCTNVASPRIYTTISLNILDSGYKIEYVDIPEISWSSKYEPTPLRHEFVLPVNHKRLIILVHSGAPSIDTIELAVDFELLSHHNDGDCGDPYFITYKLTRLSIARSSFDSTAFKYGFQTKYGWGDIEYVRDTIYCKP